MRFFFPLFAISACLFAEEDPFCSNSGVDLCTTSHIYSANGRSIPYTTLAGTLPIVDIEGEDLAHIFFIAYFAEEGSNRPITFIFPGGPGGSCSAEVLCTVGPRRLTTPAEGKTILPPYTLIDNPESLLAWTDLVFVDPVTTGYSRFAKSLDEDRKAQILSTDGDIACLGDFVQTFVSLFQKWNCPKYLMGISYGTTRCCGLSEYLRWAYDFSLHGVILLGSALDYSTLIAERNHPLPDSLLIPTFAATAWFHGRAAPGKTLEQVVSEARAFVYNDYLRHILFPYKLNAYEENVFYSGLASLIGLKEETVRRYCGRFDERLFTTEFMGEERKVIGGLDTRYVGDLSSPQRRGEDPSYRDMQGLGCAFNLYLQTELEMDRPLEPPYVDYAHNRWNFSTYDSMTWPDVFQRLRRTLIHNPEMKVFSGSGYYDCRTPFAATEYCFNHLELPLSYQKNLQFEYYPAGHGFVFDLPSLQKLQRDLIRFYER